MMRRTGRNSGRVKEGRTMTGDNQSSETEEYGKLIATRTFRHVSFSATSL